MIFLPFLILLAIVAGPWLISTFGGAIVLSTASVVYMGYIAFKLWRLTCEQ